MHNCFEYVSLIDKYFDKNNETFKVGLKLVLGKSASGPDAVTTFMDLLKSGKMTTEWIELLIKLSNACQFQINIKLLENAIDFCDKYNSDETKKLKVAMEKYLKQ